MFIWKWRRRAQKTEASRRRCVLTQTFCRFVIVTPCSDRKQSSVHQTGNMKRSHWLSVHSWAERLLLPHCYRSANLWPAARNTIRFTILEKRLPAITNQLILDGWGQMPGPGAQQVPPVKTFFLEFNFLLRAKALSWKCHQLKNQMWR